MPFHCRAALGRRLAWDLHTPSTQRRHDPPPSEEHHSLQPDRPMRRTCAIVPGLLTVLLTFSSLAPTAVDAQQGRWSFEARLGATLPSGDLSDAPLEQTAGLVLGGDVMYTLSPNFSIYAGGSHNRFNCDGCDADVTTSGFDAGGKILFGSDGAAMPWVRGGLLLHQPDVEGAEGDWEIGLDSGAGIDWRVRDGVWLVPAVRFQTYSTDGDASVTWLTIDLGVHFHPGG